MQILHVDSDMLVTRSTTVYPLLVKCGESNVFSALHSQKDVTLLDNRPQKRETALRVAETKLRQDGPKSKYFLTQTGSITAATRF